MTVEPANKNGSKPQTCAVSEWAGGYTLEFASQILVGAKVFLDRMKAEGKFQVPIGYPLVYYGQRHFTALFCVL